MSKTRLKAYIAVITVSLMTSLFLILPVRAQFFQDCTTCTSNHYLSEIANYTYRVLEAVNNTPDFFEPLSKYALSFLQPDDSDITATLQQDFTKLSNAVLLNDKQQVDYQPIFLNDFFTRNGKDPMPTTASLPFANEVTFTTMLGKPYFKDPEQENGQFVDSALRYVENASGQAVPHTAPKLNFAGSQADQDKYKSYYKTISAIQTFNTYVMSELYVNAKNKYNLSKAQLKLMQDATNADTWFKQVATEDLGIVLRQILLFDSQIYVLLINSLQLQKQMVAAQTMANSLMIIGNQFTEQTLLANAERPR